MNSHKTLITGGDPRHLAEFSALRDEMGKLHHPARPDVDWARVEQLCLALFRQNGVELQTTVDFTLARTHIAGIAGLYEGLELLAGLLSHQWSALWPLQTHARVALLAWLSDRLQQVWRTMTLCYGDLALVYRAEHALEQLCAQLQTLELKHLSKLDGVRLMLHNAALRLESAEAAAEIPARLSVPVRHAGVSEPQLSPQPVLSFTASRDPLVYIINEPAPARIQVALSPPSPPPLSWKAGHGFVAGLSLMALLMAGSFFLWQSLSSDPLEAALLTHVTPLPAPLTAKSIDELRKQTSDAKWARLVEPVLQASAAQLAQLPPLWAQEQGDALLAQAQQLWPASQEVKRLGTLWQQQREAGAAPLVELEHYALAQDRLRQLAERLNSLDEKKGGYMTVSELKSAVFAIQQPLIQTLPLEELLRQYKEQSASGQTLPSALRQQIDSRFTQLLNRYTLLTSPETASPYHYATIGELCDCAPEIKGWKDETLPRFHFPPDKSLKGLEIGREHLEKRHVIEICPFRAWVLALHDTKEYSLANGYNLGLMANMAYTEKRIVESFFLEKCLDLSTTPRHEESPAYPYALAVDVPFSQRYITAEFLDSKSVNTPGSSKPLLDSTQFFYVECEEHLAVAWRGTQEVPDWLTDGAFSPQPCPTELANTGCIHGGFLDAYHLAKQTFEKEFGQIKTSLAEANGKKKLFICGHSLGGALGLTYAAEMKAIGPLLYTYGMPRTFTADAVGSLYQITHYRHVNDTDTITSVPFDADMDNWLYGKFGPLGSTLGFFWTLLAELPAQMVGAYVGEHYWHHGKPVVFFRTTQTHSSEECQVMMNPNTCRRLSYSLPRKAKLFLVPSLSETENEEAKEAQEAFVREYPGEDMQRIFPRNTNPKFDHMTNPMRHSMASEYLPFLNNQLLESAWPELAMQRKTRRDAFQLQMNQYVDSTPVEELTRNRMFLALQKMLGSALDITKKTPGGENALIRFKSVVGEEVEII